MGYKLVDRQTIYTGRRIRLELHHLENEETGERLVREVCVHPGAVVVLPFLDDDTVLLIRQRRYALNEYLLELPAGTLEQGEDPLNCAGRELVEETGYLAGRLKPLRTTIPSPGVLSERIHAFAAYDLAYRGAAREPGEEIELVATAWDDVVAMIGDGRIVDGKTVTTVLTYERFVRGRS